jgi:hypothetical protein
VHKKKSFASAPSDSYILAVLFMCFAGISHTNLRAGEALGNRKGESSNFVLGVPGNEGS